jgi:5'(3')-deoxyribonucleotidase
MRRKLVVGVDLDGCVYRFVDAMRHYAHRVDGVPLASMGPVRSWDAMTAQWGWSDDEFADRYRRALHDGELFWHGGTYPGALEALGRIAADGHRVEVVTARVLDERDRDLVHRATTHWLDRHGVRYHAVHLRHDKHRLAMDCAIDDAPHNVEALESAGRRPFLIDRPWNRRADVRRRVHSWSEFADAVEALAHRAA